MLDRINIMYFLDISGSLQIPKFLGLFSSSSKNEKVLKLAIN